MSDFTPGQRWISDGEANLGLGTILHCDIRTVRVFFAASEETRTYSVRQAPLTRVVFGSGDVIESDEGARLRVEDTKEQDGLTTYICQRDDGELVELPETRLNDRMAFHQARDKLLTGQVDRNDAFNFRYRSLNHHHRVQRHPGYGFSGPKVDLIPHQMNIAFDVARRHLPRVLLADEVGLGKTIEAGLILHRLLLTGRVSRTLILVPESLTHQWLVELLRRFGLEARLLDETQSQQLDSDTNPFDSAQLILTSAQWLFANPHRQRQAEDSEWDLLIVDEAHHLNADAPEAGYGCVERLATHSQGVLLLTATPDQLGTAHHFALLRLLDPERYHDLDAFRDAENGYAQLADALDALTETRGSGNAPDDTLLGYIREVLSDDPDASAALETLCTATDISARQPAFATLRDALLDRHGTGRVMFHHSRRDIDGFPERRLHVHRFEAPSPYRRVLRRLDRDEDYLDTLMIEHELAYPDVLLYPEATYTALTTEDADPWWQLDPRVEALQQWLKDHPNEKALVICHSGETAQALAEGLRVRMGLHAPVFHEGTTLIERDRAAAAFVDEEAHCPLLICAEIGAEGRNFQCCHHLIMFDMPAHPDQVEQRIGRLDRIGQRYPIEIHLFTLDDTPMQALARWYDEGLHAFGAPTGLGGELYEAFSEPLDAALLDSDALDELIDETHTALQQRQQARQAGRYRLLAQRGQDDAEALADMVRDADDSERLQKYLDQASDAFGFELRDLGGELLHVVPTGQLLDGLPGLVKGEAGFTATLSREVALSRDDVERLSWEHPLVQELLSRASDGPHGNTALALLKHPAIPAGRLMTEVVFATQTPAPKALYAGRFLPPTSIRILLDDQGNDLTKSVSFGGLAKHLQRVKRAVARNLIKECLPQLRDMLDKAERQAERALPALIEDAHQQMCDTLDHELSRLKALAARNPAVRQGEIHALQHERDQLDTALQDTRLRLDAVRVIVTVDPQS